nr:MAG TPA: hypothetical protein [Microviridae sp.]
MSKKRSKGKKFMKCWNVRDQTTEALENHKIYHAIVKEEE